MVIFHGYVKEPDGKYIWVIPSGYLLHSHGIDGPLKLMIFPARNFHLQGIFHGYVK